MRSTQLGIPGMTPDGKPRSRAAGLQRSITDADNVLTTLAHRRGKIVAWWWGVRKVDGVTCGLCYVCDQIITEGALNLGITSDQMDAIDRHRADHWKDIKAVKAETE